MTMQSPDRILGERQARQNAPISTADYIAAATRLSDEIVRAVRSNQPIQETVQVPDGIGGYTSELALTQHGIYIDGLLAQYEAIEQFLPDREKNQISASVAAQLAESRANREESTRQFNEQLEYDQARDKADREEDVRGTNISATLDLLEADVRRGELSAVEATNRFRAAAEAAGLQREVLTEVGGRALPAGTPYFPNLGPSSAIADLARSIGMPFGGFETMGTYGVNPAAVAATIPGAMGQAATPGVDAAINNAAAALAGMGVTIPPTPAGRQQRPPSNAVTNAATAMSRY